jgi:hypothetical protein
MIVSEFVPVPVFDCGSLITDHSKCINLDVCG